VRAGFGVAPKRTFSSIENDGIKFFYRFHSNKVRDGGAPLPARETRYPDQCCGIGFGASDDFFKARIASQRVIINCEEVIVAAVGDRGSCRLPVQISVLSA
jgi:hypothetical protein